MENPIKDIRYYLMLVPDNGTSQPMSPEEDTRTWGIFRRLPQKSQDILTARETPFLLEGLAKYFRLPEQLIGAVSVLIRRIFFGEIDLAQMEAKLGSLLAQSGGGDPNRAKEIVQFVDQKILHLVPKPVVEDEEETSEQERKETVIHLPLLRAMADYANLGFQVITNEKIRLKGQGEPQRPTLSNWIHYYRDELGVGFHDEVQRGRFLFQTENGRRLSSEERERLNLILKSIEEDFPLDIDTAHQTIVFPPSTGGTGMPGRMPSAQPMTQAPAAARGPAQPNQAPPAFAGGRPAASPQAINRPPLSGQSLAPLFSNRGTAAAKNVAGETLHFSTGHVLPAEKGGAPNASSPRPPLPGRNPYSIRPLRLRQERDKQE